jgi:hypothetical protein
VRPKEAPHRHWEFNVPTGIGLQEFLAHRHVQHSPKNSQFLMNRGWPEHSHLPVAERGFDSNRFSNAVTKVQLDIIRRDFHQFPRTESTLDVLCDS